VTQVEADQAALGVIHALAKAVEAKDIYTYGHSREVNKYAIAFAEAIGLSKERQSYLSASALLHDIGKIGVPDKVLRKQGKLNDEEWQMIKEHPKLSATIVSHVSSLLPCRLGILYHHERWDGTGYPAGLRGEETPLEARILAIADAFTALTSARPYRPSLSYEQAIEEIKRGAGTQFDPNLAETFVTVVQKLLAQQSSKRINKR
jgi:HD-GYP domain-containing protein (c-di-GMP phosphodiesterase class II)